MKFKALFCAFAAIASLGSSASAAWPEDHTVEVVVGFAPGGGTDIMARRLVPFLEKHLGGKAHFVVVNKPGASGELANTYVAKSNPDGYTIGIVNVPAFLYLPLARNAHYRPDDFRLIARVVDDPTVLIARSESKIDSLQTVVGVSRQTPGAISVGHNGEGSNGDLAIQMLQSRTGIQLNPIPYKGTGVQKTDLLGGHIELGTVSVGEIPELHNGGKGLLKAVVQFTARRSSALPNVPTASEAGVPVLMSSERGFAAPKAIDPTIAARLEKAIGESLSDPEFLKAAATDAPVLAFLPGAQWTKSLQKNNEALKKLAEVRR